MTVWNFLKIFKKASSRWPVKAFRARSRLHPKSAAFFAVMAIFATMLSFSGLGPAYATTPGTPGVPQTGTPIYTEDFNNLPNTTATGAKSYSAAGSTTYVGSTGQTYTGSPQWINGSRCNGLILNYSNSTTPSWAQSGTSASDSGVNGRCSDFSGVRSYQFLRMLALAMGQQFAPASPSSYNVVSSYTECQSTSSTGGTCDILPVGPNVATGSVMFKTVQPITTIPGHYYAFSVNTAYINCGMPGADPGYQFATVDPVTGAVISNLGTPLNGCSTATSPNVTTYTQSVTSNVGGAFGTVTKTVNLASMTTNQSFQATGTSIGLEMYNTNGTTNGNDGAFSNIKLVDVTPQLDKSFLPALIAPGQTSTTTLTITNTSELNAKTDWSITDTLPAGLVIAPNPAIGGTCTQVTGAPFVKTGTVGSSVFTATGGDLAQGQSSCTITFNVTAAAEGTYVNGPGNIATNLNPPANATLVVRAPRITLIKALGAPREAATDQFTMQIRTGGATGTVVNNPANSTTAGAGSTVTPGTGTTGAYIASAGTTYTLTEAAAGTTNLANYSGTVTCTDSFGLQTGLPNGAAYTGSLAITPVVGANITCTLSNNALPIINVAKQTGTVTGPDTNGTYLANYTITIANSGSVAGAYGALTDTPAFASNLAPTGAVWTTSGTGAPAGGSSSTAGPYTLAPAGSGIGAGVTQTFNLAVTFHFTNTSQATACAGPGTGLFNSAALPAGQEQGPTTDNAACDTPPASNLVASKSVNPTAGTMVQPGQVLTYTLTFDNTAGTAPAAIGYTDWLGNVLDDTTFVANSITTTTTSGIPLVVANNSGAATKTLGITGTVSAGTKSVVTYQVKVNSDGSLGNASIENYLTPSTIITPPTSCPAGSTTCTVNPVGSWTLGKTASPASGTYINPGDPSANRVITYSVTATSSTVNPITGVILSDDLSQVLNNATFTAGSAKLTINGGTPLAVADPGAGNKLITPSFTLPGNGTAVLTYSVTVNTNAWLVTLKNGATGNGVIPPARCVTGNPAPLDPACFTTNPTTGHLFVQKAGPGPTQGSTVPLTGSSFEIHNDAAGQMGTTLIGVNSTVSGSPGLVEARNLLPGTYWLLETTAPNGYSLLATPVKFTVAANGSITLDPATAGTSVTANGVTITVLDMAAVKLPAAGGPGYAGPFGGALLGILLLMISLALIVIRRADKTPHTQIAESISVHLPGDNTKGTR
ncbi:beta strand repeat-containing protein [Arthrobacter sp. B2a2-09]|uniref:beta strand repeat-containing protein n=1 Tax=Arthrobacter sp. B2a2-09 TaxID=2952822 RepID=UPI0022CD4AA2|nr:prealbumin-like fold domain-containing protein [Arthrobacter sp. B2a2-09]MCZ9881940.1 prealbumin-like fold domain-containing protein [Arthrobacter sp. B2a2-09]